MSRTGLLVAALTGATVFANGCGSDLPNGNGRIWECIGLIHENDPLGGSQVIQAVDPSGAPFTECANADVAKSDVVSQCQSDCEDAYSGSFPWDIINTIAGIDTPDCSISDADVTSSPCGGAVAAVTFLNGGPYQSRAQATANMNLNVSGNTGSTAGSGTIAYTIGQCNGDSCAFNISRLTLTSLAPFTIGGQSVTFANVQSFGLAQGTFTQSTSTFVIPPNAFQGQVDFVVDGRQGSLVLPNPQAIQGSVEGDSLSFSGTLAAGDQSINITATGTGDQHPPTVSLSPKSSTFECTGSGAATVTFSAAANDVDGDLHEIIWSADKVPQPVTGSSLTLTLSLGAHIVGVAALDSRGAAAFDTSQFTVVDTTPPHLTLPANVNAHLCQTSGVVQVGRATATDACGTPTVSGSIVSRNGVPLSPPVPVVNGQATLGLGTYQVQWTASDGVNQSQGTQTIVVGPGIETSQNLLVDDRAAVRATGGTTAAVLNSGSGETRIGNDAVSGPIVSVAHVDVLDRAHVGSITSASSVTVSNTAVVGGPIVQFASVTLPALPALPTFPVAQPGFTLNSGQSRTLAAGSYGSVILNSQSTLTLGSGDYFFHDLTINAGVVVRATSTTRVFVQTSMVMQSPFTNSSGQTQAITLGFGGTTLSLLAPFNGNLLAPNASVSLGTDTSLTFTGTLLCRSLEVMPQNTIVCQ